ncbi:sulfite oxidase [Cecembia lonarensis]|uniref:Oxidoreductase molybdopterin binding domain protein n=1 Tax=Cecembia lonarensis (strain CCUG 58316 / KCTC 22772 / LW9) TaxID=1225176 RepID=K1LYY5_CECL9|nr:sulfite oxidase [Cecembia lonarensis]EKB49299.1 Oxidoreductase molybdopterin binding domain protein [Cecembia lonarensis LW9]
MKKGKGKQRRAFIKNSAYSILASLVGMEIVFANKMPVGYEPIIFQEKESLKSLGKEASLTVLNDKPWNVETPVHLLDDQVTPASKMFIRNNGLLPDRIKLEDWTLTLQGESVKSTKTYSMSDIKDKFRHYSYHLVLECGGNGRGEFYPPTEGNQWGVGAVSCAKWTGIRLKDLLQDVGINNDAVYIGYHGLDSHLSGDPNKEAISRGIPLWKALQEETLLAFALNDEELPLAHGFPLRLVAGGFPASASGKWLKALSVRNKVHDGSKMESPSYRIPISPIEPGSSVDEDNMRIIESMPVRSIITYPKSGAQLPFGRKLNIRGHAWAGEEAVKQVEYSIDFGSTWQLCNLEKPINRLAWQHFSATIEFPIKGYYEVWVKAIDMKGVSQPMVVPAWNPKGYLNNACHRIAVKLT